jgi:hypothetical protein
LICFRSDDGVVFVFRFNFYFNFRGFLRVLYPFQGMLTLMRVVTVACRRVL